MKLKVFTEVVCVCALGLIFSGTAVADESCGKPLTPEEAIKQAKTEAEVNYLHSLAIRGLVEERIEPHGVTFNVPDDTMDMIRHDNPIGTLNVDKPPKYSCTCDDSGKKCTVKQRGPMLTCSGNCSLFPPKLCTWGRVK